MFRSLRGCRAAFLPALMLAALTGCPDSQPLPSHYRDLGDGATVLVPVPSEWYPVAYKERDAAEWVPFREPNFDEEDEEEVEAAAEEESEVPAGETEDAQGVLAEVREFIDSYDELEEQRDIEGLLEYHIESQRETIKLVLEASFEMADKLEAIHTTLSEKLPDQGERIEDLFETLAAASKLAGVVGTLTVVGDTEVIGRMPYGGPHAGRRFVVIDDEWFIEVPDLPDAAAVQAQLKGGVAMFQSMLDGLESGAMPPAAVLQGLDAMAQAAKTAPESGGDEGEASGAAGDEDEEAEEQDEEEGGTEGDEEDDEEPVVPDEDGD